MSVQTPKHEVRIINIPGEIQLRLFPENYMVASWDRQHLRWCYEFDLAVPMTLALPMFAVSMTYSGRHDSAETVCAALNVAIKSVEG